MKRCSNCDNDRGDYKEDSLDIQEVWDIDRCQNMRMYKDG